MRKDHGLHLSDRIHIYLLDVPALSPALATFTDYMKKETLASQIHSSKDLIELKEMVQKNQSQPLKEVTFDDIATFLSIQKAAT